MEFMKKFRIGSGL